MQTTLAADLNDSNLSQSSQRLFKQLYPAIIWGLAACFVFYNYVLQVAPSIISQQLMSTFHVNAAHLGNLGAAYFYPYMLMQIPVGLLLDRFGIRWPTTLAIAIGAAGAYGFAHAESFSMAFLMRTIMGFGCAFASVSCLKLAAEWFSGKWFPVLAGLMMTVAMLGAVFGTAPLVNITHTIGWRSTLVILSFAGAILALVYLSLVRQNKQCTLPATANKTSTWAGLQAVFRSPQTWLLSFYSGFAFSPVSAFGGLWGVPYLESTRHLSTSSSAAIVSYIFLGFALGAPLSGMLSNYFGRCKPLMLFGSTMAFISFTLALYLPIDSIVILKLMMFSFGFFASFFLLCFTMLQRLHSAALVATAIGFMNSFDALWGAVTEPFIGKLLDFGWSGKIVAGAHVFPIPVWHEALVIMPIFLLLCVGLMFFIREP